MPVPSTNTMAMRNNYLEKKKLGETKKSVPNAKKATNNSKLNISKNKQHYQTSHPEKEVKRKRDSQQNRSKSIKSVEEDDKISPLRTQQMMVAAPLESGLVEPGMKQKTLIQSNLATQNMKDAVIKLLPP